MFTPDVTWEKPLLGVSRLLIPRPLDLSESNISVSANTSLISKHAVFLYPRLTPARMSHKEKDSWFYCTYVRAKCNYRAKSNRLSLPVKGDKIKIPRLLLGVFASSSSPFTSKLSPPPPGGFAWGFAPPPLPSLYIPFPHDTTTTTMATHHAAGLGLLHWAPNRPTKQRCPPSDAHTMADGGEERKKKGERRPASVAYMGLACSKGSIFFGDIRTTTPTKKRKGVSKTRGREIVEG